MKNRNPLVIAGLPYVLIYFGYTILQIAVRVSLFDSNRDFTTYLIPIAIGLVPILIGACIFVWWLAVTAKSLRKETGHHIPSSILIVIPLANYYWIWKYSQAVEIYTKSKIQTALAFIVVALLGPIGAGILQDSFNKVLSKSEH